MIEVCRCGAPIELYTLRTEWCGLAEGIQIWHRAKRGADHPQGRAICDGVTLDDMPPTGHWLPEHLHRPLPALEDAIAGLQWIRVDLEEDS